LAIFLFILIPPSRIDFGRDMVAAKISSPPYAKDGVIGA
jgi:hypothetical protein